MSIKFVAYVDESGDEGFGKLRSPTSGGQSNWLALGAAVVSSENDSDLVSWRDSIMAAFPRKNARDLHFRKLNHNQRVAACNLLARRPVGICFVASNKVTLLDDPRLTSLFKRKQHLYNYLVRYLLERVTTACRVAARLKGSKDAELHVVFSRRGGTDYQTMREYLELMRDGREVIAPVRSIDWAVLDPANISVENHSKRAGLQIADVLTSATCAALEPDEFGNTEPRYALSLCRRYIKAKKLIQNAGLTIIPAPWKCPLTDDQRRFLSDLEEKARPPGS